MAGSPAVRAPRDSQPQAPGILAAGAHPWKRGREAVAPLLVGAGLKRLLFASLKRSRAPPTRGPPHLYSSGGAGSGLPTPGATAISGGPGPAAVT